MRRQQHPGAWTDRIQIDGSFWTISLTRRYFVAPSRKTPGTPGLEMLKGRSANATTPEGNLSQWMRQLKTAYTVYFNRRHQVVGHLFQGRFKSTVIGAEEYLLEVSRYLHLNPVRGMVLGQGTAMERLERPREYRWRATGVTPGWRK
jgi:hypothetical protein